MKTLISLTTLICAFFLTTVQAQSTFDEFRVGIRAGLGSTSARGPEAQSSKFSGPVFQGGLFTQFTAFGTEIELEALATGRKYSYTQTISRSVNDTLRDITLNKEVKSTYLDFPLLIRIPVSDGLRFVFGPMFSLRMSEKETLPGSREVDDGYALSWYDVNALAGLTYELPNKIDFSLRGQYGVLPLFYLSAPAYAVNKKQSIRNMGVYLTVGLPLSSGKEGKPQEKDKGDADYVY